jgi:hypothetical protein
MLEHTVQVLGPVQAMQRSLLTAANPKDRVVLKNPLPGNPSNSNRSTS